MSDNLCQIKIFCSPTMTRKDNMKPVVTYFDITFLDPSLLLQQSLYVITFENYYVSSMSCAQQVSDGNDFVILDRKLLMPSASSIVGSQQLFTLYATEFNS